MAKEIDEDTVKDLKCIYCKEEGCCPGCSFFDQEGKLYPVCHDCGVAMDDMCDI
jgi:hypothetical protein